MNVNVVGKDELNDVGLQHCWHCFKDSSSEWNVEGITLKLCRSCQYVLKNTINFLAAYGIVLRQRQPSLPGLEPVGEEGKKGVSRGKKGAEDPSLNGQVTDEVEAVV